MSEQEFKKQIEQLGKLHEVAPILKIIAETLVREFSCISCMEGGQELLALAKMSLARIEN